ncbi:vWA domain-containing protein [Edaphobacillus lindanitolerans]|uniref:von Willebrand factor type A domain-containing protein n=1 Tax=Edaphobacillus lindanitolerans TaxID=550447 RepID=A0A1U7PJC5_9BACI|nr:BatA and WFA domain-containing protein [Edaphobacillus lindanitolerans]SIT68338.1 von Willebrand factor type A domain-containing protein [Edaphobacillus lindanitolerans]
MGFGSPGMIWTAVIPAAVLLYYFLSKRYEERTVPSTMLWEESFRHTEATPMLRHLRRNALFYLQMAALLLLVFLLLGPRFPKASEQTGEVLLIIDSSASMMSEDRGEPVFEHHRKAMEELVRESGDSRFTVILAGESPEILLRRAEDKKEVLEVVGNLKISYAPEHMESTLAFAVSATEGEPANVHVFTDGLDRGGLPSAPGISWHVHAASQEPANVSVDAFGVARTSAIVRLSNESDDEKQVVLHLRDEKGERAGKPVNRTIGAGSTENIRIDGLPDAAAFSLLLETDDGYKPDNEAFTASGGRPLPVYADARLHELLLKGLRASGFEIFAFSPDEAGSIPEEAVVFTPDEKLFLQRGDRTVLFGRESGEPADVQLTVSSASDPLFSFASPEGVYVSGLYPPFDGFTTAAEAGGRPFVQRSADGGIAVLADPGMTDWALRPSFPLFLWSAVNRYSAETGGLGSFLPGEGRPVPAPEEGDVWEVFTAAGEYVKETGTGSGFQAPEKPGLYVLRSGDEERYMAVVLPDSEKHPASGPSFSLGSTGEEKEDGGRGAEREKASAALPFILLVLGLIVAEWEVQRRRGLSY